MKRAAFKLKISHQVYSSPDKDPNLSDYERDLVEQERKAEYGLDAQVSMFAQCSAINEEDGSMEALIVVPPKFSFKTILSSGPVWASLINKFSSGLGYYVITTKIPVRIALE